LTCNSFIYYCKITKTLFLIIPQSAYYFKKVEFSVNFAKTMTSNLLLFSVLDAGIFIGFYEQLLCSPFQLAHGF